MPDPVLDSLCNQLRTGGSLTLFLDYDGTLAEIGPTAPQADETLIRLLTDLVQSPAIQPIILSGRTLDSLRALLPVPGLTLAGVYGIEVQHLDGSRVSRITSSNLRPSIAKIASEWIRLTANHTGFLVEDKGYAVVLHSEAAEVSDAEPIEKAAREAAHRLMDSAECRTIEGPRFLEVAPISANKGLSVEWFLDKAPPSHSLPVYFGDDENDDVAFAVIRQRGGIAMGVGRRFPLAHATVHLDSVAQVHEWLATLLAAAGEGSHSTTAG